MKILIWATTLQADILALSLFLDRQKAVDLMVVTEHLEAYHKEPIATLLPMEAPLLDRSTPRIVQQVRAFSPDLVVADNHLPLFLSGIRFVTMWHGLGWKARGREDLKVFYKNVRRLTGQDPRQSGTRFLAQCYGEPDRQWRIQNWGLHQSSCVAIGSCFSDLLRAPPYSKAHLQERYTIDIVNRPVVLLSIGWHYGRILAENRKKTGLFQRDRGITEDMALLTAMLDTIRDQGASCLLCLHDKKRYDKAYLGALEERVRTYSNLMVKHKSDYPDNLADLTVADVMVSNLSSFITFFYHSGRPTVHLLPGDTQNLHFAKVKRGGVDFRRVASSEAAYMTNPLDNGGLVARTLPEVVQGIQRGLQEPDCCRERAASWIERHILLPNGTTCERFYNSLVAFMEGKQCVE